MGNIAQNAGSGGTQGQKQTSNVDAGIDKKFGQSEDDDLDLDTEVEEQDNPEEDLEGEASTYSVSQNQKDETRRGQTG